MARKKFRRHAKRTRVTPPRLQNTCAARPTYCGQEARREERGESVSNDTRPTNIKNILNYENCTEKFRRRAKCTRATLPTMQNTCAARPTCWRSEERREEKKRKGAHNTCYVSRINHLIEVNAHK